MEFVHHGLENNGNFLHHGIRRIHGIEIEDDKVGPLDELHAGTPGILRNGAHVCDIEQLVPIRADEITDVPLHIRRPDFLGANPVGSVVVRILLIEVLAMDPVRVTVEDERAIEQMRHQHRSDAVVKANQIAFRETVLGPIDFVLVGQFHASDSLGRRCLPLRNGVFKRAIRRIDVVP
jgi:hypothetical protein